MSEQIGPVFDPADFAGFWRRTVALFLDAVILYSIRLVAMYSWFFLAPPAWVTEIAYWRIEFIWVCVAVVYLLGWRLTVFGTPGYRLVGIRYAHMLSEEPSRSALGFRAAVALVLMWFFALDHFWILFDRNKQAWHDKVSGFYVVRRHAKPIGNQKVVRRLINFMMLSFVVWEPVDSTS